MKKYLLTGLIIFLPVALTLLVIGFLFDLFTEPFVHLIEPLFNLFPYPLPHSSLIFLSRLFSLILLVVFIFSLGIVTQFFIVKVFMNSANRILFRIPFINTVYKVSRDIFAALFSSDGKKAFKRPVMIPFPMKPHYCLGFEAGETAAIIQKKISTPLVPVFAPTAPHPISGFLFLVPQNDVHPVDMTNEEMVKFLVSCGMVLPESAKDGHDEPF